MAIHKAVEMTIRNLLSSSPGTTNTKENRMLLLRTRLRPTVATRRRMAVVATDLTDSHPSIQLILVTLSSSNTNNLIQNRSGSNSSIPRVERRAIPVTTILEPRLRAAVVVRRSGTSVATARTDEGRCQCF